MFHDFAVCLHRYLVAVSLQFVGKVYIGCVNMSADFEIHDVHVGEVLFHDKAVIDYPHILFVDVGDFLQ